MTDCSCIIRGLAQELSNAITKELFSSKDIYFSKSEQHKEIIICVWPGSLNKILNLLIIYWRPLEQHWMSYMTKLWWSIHYCVDRKQIYRQWLMRNIPNFLIMNCFTMNTITVLALLELFAMLPCNTFLWKTSIYTD